MRLRFRNDTERALINSFLKEAKPGEDGFYRLPLFIHDGSEAKIEAVGVNREEVFISAFRLRREASETAKKGMI
jgi:hypothetical protein